jgi:hypothetical protein
VRSNCCVCALTTSSSLVYPFVLFSGSFCRDVPFSIFFSSLNRLMLTWLEGGPAFNNMSSSFPDIFVLFFDIYGLSTPS